MRLVYITANHFPKHLLSLVWFPAFQAAIGFTSLQDAMKINLQQLWIANPSDWTFRSLCFTLSSLLYWHTSVQVPEWCIFFFKSRYVTKFILRLISFESVFKTPRRRWVENNSALPFQIKSGFSTEINLWKSCFCQNTSLCSKKKNASYPSFQDVLTVFCKLFAKIDQDIWSSRSHLPYRFECLSYEYKWRVIGNVIDWITKKKCYLVWILVDHFRIKTLKIWNLIKNWWQVLSFFYCHKTSQNIFNANAMHFEYSTLKTKHKH